MSRVSAAEVKKATVSVFSPSVQNHCPQPEHYQLRSPTNPIPTSFLRLCLFDRRKMDISMQIPPAFSAQRQVELCDGRLKELKATSPGLQSDSQTQLSQIGRQGRSSVNPRQQTCSVPYMGERWPAHACSGKNGQHRSPKPRRSSQLAPCHVVSLSHSLVDRC